MWALLARPPCALRYTEVSRSPCTQRTQPEQLCLCLWQFEILCAPVVTQQCSLPPTSRSWKLTQLLAERQGKKGWCLSTVFISLSCLHGFLFWFPSRFDLSSTTTTPTPDCVLLSMRACKPEIWKGFWASPHNSLPHRHPPVLPHSPQTLSTSESAVAEVSNQQWHFPWCVFLSIALKNESKAVATPATCLHLLLARSTGQYCCT